MNESIMLQLLNGTEATKDELVEVLRNSEEIITKELEELYVKRNFIRDILGELDKYAYGDEEFFAELFEDE